MRMNNFPIGFSATGLNADISYKKSKKDLALFYSHLPAVGAGVFTKNKVKAAPILLTQNRLVHGRGKVRSFLVNSGSANAATGREGRADAKTISAWLEKGLSLNPEEVWLASTGLIGARIKMIPFKKGLKKLWNGLKRKWFRKEPKRPRPL